MKSTRKRFRTILLLLSICFVSTDVMMAQVDAAKNRLLISAMWQYESTMGNGFVKDKSGWGMGVEATYPVLPRLEVGGFLNWHTSNQYIPRTTYDNGTSAITMDQSRSLFQIPMGLSANFVLVKSDWIEPYIGLKFGANYARYRTYSNIFLNERDNWGVYVAPEVGVTVFPFARARFLGFKVSGYYGYSSNSYKNSTTDMANINNLGLRLGMKFRI